MNTISFSPGQPFMGRRPMAPALAPKREGRRGVALILILGLIALFLLIAFAFSVKTRTDRWMARSSVSVHRTHHILVQALDQAMLEGTHYLTVDPALYSYWFYPRREYINSSAVMPGNSGADWFSGLLSPPMDSYIPWAVYPYVQVDAAQMRWGIIAGNYGASVSDFWGVCPGGCPNRIVATDFEPTGIAYYLVNCSGYLDINAPYDTAARQYGTNVSELQVDNLVSNSLVLGQARQNSGGHIDTMPELYAFCSNGVDLTAFFPFSHFVTGEYYDTNSQQAVPSFALTNTTPPFLSTNAEPIMSAFANAGFNQDITVGSATIAAPAIRGWLYTNLLDYIDSDDRPKGDMQPSQEHVPGFNEVQIRGTYSCTRTGANAYTFNLSIWLSLELWNAHVYRDTNPNYEIRCNSPGASLPGVRFQLVSGYPAGFTAGGIANISWTTPIALGAFVTNTFPVINQSSSAVADPAPYTQIVYTVRLNDLKLMDGSDSVDFTARHTFTCTNILAGADTNMTIGTTVFNTPNDQIAVNVESIDPRFNWEFTNQICWASTRPASTLGTTNATTIAYLTDVNNKADSVAPIDDSDTYMFCQSGPLTTAGDLGYLVYAPWRTIKLYSTNGISPCHRVIDTFTLKSPGQVEKGLVNPNTAHQKVLAAVFKDMPINRFPGDTIATNRLTWAQALTVAERTLRFTYGTTNIIWNPAEPIMSSTGVRNGQLNVSDTYRTPNLFSDDAFLNGLGATSEFTREALVRNSSGLLSTRQNLFTIFLAATDELDGGGGGDFRIRTDSRSGAERRAVSLVWFDPWTQQAYPQYPEQFVRFFRLVPSDGDLARY